jgi:predicted ester cyclase
MFSEINFQFEDQIAEANKVVSRITIHARHTDGKPISVRFIDIAVVVDGKVREEWGIVDSLSMMRQLGLIPAS